MMAALTSDVQDLRREAEAMSAVGTHSCLLQLLAVEVDWLSRISILTPVAQYGCLPDFIDHLEFENALASFTRAHAARAGAQIIDAVLHLHVLGYRHNDLFPRNVLVFNFKSGAIDTKLADFESLSRGGADVRAVAQLLLQIADYCSQDSLV